MWEAASFQRLFIILLLVVIFSQITGVGIDNYGIKKILPKLIIAAILINLSYWICVAFVDLSNILGNSFQAMFNGLGANISTTNEYAKKALEDSIAAGGATVVSVVIIAGLLAAVVAASALNQWGRQGRPLGAEGLFGVVWGVWPQRSCRQAL